ncbi:MAG TPA: sodium:solute symporter, partial [Candidatus Nitrosotenuis sp.]
MVEITGYGVAVIAFLAASLIIGTLTYKLVQKSGRRLIVAGKSLPLFMVGTMLVAQSVDGNSSLGAIALIYQYGFWAGAVIPIGLGICLIMTGAFYGKKLNKMSMFTLPDYYFRRYGNASEGISGIL